MRGRVELLIPLSLSLRELQLLSLLLSLDGGLAGVVSHARMIRLESSLESIDLAGRGVQVPLQVSTHLPLHLVHLLERKHLLGDNTPTLVRVSVIADDLASDHERRDE